MKLDRINLENTVLNWVVWIGGAVVIGLFIGVAWGNASIIIVGWLS